jgi:hypothetical protein
VRPLPLTAVPSGSVIDEFKPSLLNVTKNAMSEMKVTYRDESPLTPVSCAVLALVVIAIALIASSIGGSTADAIFS